MALKKRETMQWMNEMEIDAVGCRNAFALMEKMREHDKSSTMNGRSARWFGAGVEEDKVVRGCQAIIDALW